MDNFSYIVQCERTRKCALIDPGNNASEAMAFIGRENLDIEWAIATHHHSDHVSEISRVAETYRCGILASATDASRIEGVTRTVTDGETVMLGSVKLEFIMTPGHTPGSMCIIADGIALFTGDTLFIGDCGRTDLGGGSNSQMFDSLQKLKSLPGSIMVYPGHDYGDRAFDTLDNQLRTNKPLVAESLDEFTRIP
jgi:hydroxyacylglutathione hydrolase